MFSTPSELVGILQSKIISPNKIIWLLCQRISGNLLDKLAKLSCNGISHIRLVTLKAFQCSSSIYYKSIGYEVHAMDLNSCSKLIEKLSAKNTSNVPLNESP